MNYVLALVFHIPLQKYICIYYVLQVVQRYLIIYFDVEERAPLGALDTTVAK